MSGFFFVLIYSFFGEQIHQNTVVTRNIMFKNMTLFVVVVVICFVIVAMFACMRVVVVVFVVI